ncbi:MAG: hypothetical protein V4719_26625 [Planctomycetota bacterium]
MALPRLHEIHPGSFDDLVINQLDQVDPSPGIEALIAMGGGTVDQLLIATAYAEPKVKVTSRDTQTVLAGCNFGSGRSIETLAKLQYQLRQNGGIYAGAGAHMTLTSTLGFLYIEEFGAKQDDKEGADISCTYVPLFDGTNLPLVVNTNQSLTGAAAANSVHAMSKVIFENSQLEGVQSFRVKSGLEVEIKRADGELYPRICVIKKRAPTIEVECLNLGIISTLTLGGTYPITNGLAAYLQRVVAGGGRYAANTNNHISARATAGSYKVESLSGSKGDNTMVKITAMQTGGPLTIATATTIP